MIRMHLSSHMCFCLRLHVPLPPAPAPYTASASSRQATPPPPAPPSPTHPPRPQLSDKCEARVFEEEEDEAKDWRVDARLRAACEKDAGGWTRCSVGGRWHPLAGLQSIGRHGCRFGKFGSLLGACRPRRTCRRAVRCAAEKLCDDVDDEEEGAVTECLVRARCYGACFLLQLSAALHAEHAAASASTCTQLI